MTEPSRKNWTVFTTFFASIHLKRCLRHPVCAPWPPWPPGGSKMLKYHGGNSIVSHSNITHSSQRIKNTCLMVLSCYLSAGVSLLLCSNIQCFKVYMTVTLMLVSSARFFLCHQQLLFLNVTLRPAANGIFLERHFQQLIPRARAPARRVLRL